MHGNFQATLFDFNEELINCYTMVRDRVTTLMPLLREHQSNHNSKYYYNIRSQLPSNLTELQRAARFIYLNKTCFNGLYRVNAKGQFNVPIGSAKKPRIFNEIQLLDTSKSLENTIIEHKDFSDVIDVAKKGDLVYFDPPYFTEGTGFTGYIVGKSGRAEFGPREQRRLANVVDQLAERGCYVVISNSSTKFIKLLYHDFHVHKVKANRLINSKATGRGPVEEVVITNYG